MPNSNPSEQTGSKTGILASILGGVAGGVKETDSLGKIKSQADYLKDVYNDISKTSQDAIGSMVGGLANLAQQWIVTGKISVRAAAQIVAGILAQLAIEDGVKALHEIAEGFAAEAITWGIPNPSSIAHFAAAAAYGISAAETGAAAIAVGIASRIGANNSASAAAGSASSANISSTVSNNSSSSTNSNSDERTISIARLQQRQPPQKAIFRVPAGSVESAIIEGLNRRTAIHPVLVNLSID